MSNSLFDPAEYPAAAGVAQPGEWQNLSAGAKRTARNKAALEAGIHPATRCPVRPELGTCSTCANHIVLAANRTWHKCKRAGITHGPGTDIRVSWPACSLYVERSE